MWLNLGQVWRLSHPAPTCCSHLRPLYVFLSSTLNHLQGKSESLGGLARTQNVCLHLSCMLNCRLRRAPQLSKTEWSSVRGLGARLELTELQPAFLWQKFHSLAYPGAWNSWSEQSNKALSFVWEGKRGIWTRYGLRDPSNPSQGFSPVRSKRWHTQEQALGCVYWQSLSNPVPFCVTAHAVLTAALCFSCPSCNPVSEVTVSFKHWRIKTKPWLEVYWFFKRCSHWRGESQGGFQYFLIYNVHFLGEGDPD